MSIQNGVLRWGTAAYTPRDLRDTGTQGAGRIYPVDPAAVARLKRIMAEKQGTRETVHPHPVLQEAKTVATKIKTANDLTAEATNVKLSGRISIQIEAEVVF